MKHLFHILTLAIILSACQTPLDKRIEQEAREYTEKHCPNWIDACTRLDSTTYDIASRTYTYWYCVTGAADSDDYFSTIQADSLLSRQRFAQALRNNPDLKQTLEAKINICYRYRSEQTQQVRFSITVTPEDYQ